MSFPVQVRNHTNNTIEEFQKAFVRSNRRPPSKAALIDLAIKKYCKVPVEYKPIREKVEEFVLELENCYGHDILDHERKISAIAWILYNKSSAAAPILKDLFEIEKIKDP